MTRSELVIEAIRKAHEEADAKRNACTVVEYFNGDKIENEFLKINGSVWARILINGKETSRSKVYHVNTDKPYTRYGGRKWYITDDYLTAMRAAV